MGIKVYNKKEEDYSMYPNDYYIGRGSILGNPFTHLPLKRTIAMYQVKNVEEALERYSGYFDLMYSNNQEFANIIDEMYLKYKNGEDIYLGCFCQSEDVCHGGVIKNKLQKRLLKEKIKEYKKKKTIN